MIDPQDDLVQLVRRCLVRIDTAGGGAGSGFWVAPGLVLTCAHVAPYGEVTVTWNSQRLTGRVVQAVPAEPPAPGDRWPYPDLALVTVPEMDGNDCVWLSEQQIKPGDPLYLLGHSAVYDTELKPHAATGTYAGPYDEWWRFAGDEIAPGMSGGPVLDLARGAVCGLVKTSREQDDDRGGLLVPIRSLQHLGSREQAALWQAHDRFHSRSPWSEARHLLAATANPPHRDTLQADEEAGLLDILTRLTQKLDLPALYAEAVESVIRLPPEPITSVRRLSYLVADRLGRPGQLHPLLRLVHRLAQGEPGATGAELHEWIVRVAARRGEYDQLKEFRRTERPRPHGSDNRPSIIVQVMPHGLNRKRYTVTLWVHEAGRSSKKIFCDDGLGHDLTETRKIITDRLRSPLKHLQGWATVEFVIPADLFDEDFENLVIFKYPLGLTNHVVIRDLERLSDDETWHSWGERWRALRAGAGSAEWLACTHRSSPAAFHASLRLRPEVALLGLARRPRQYAEDTLGPAIDAGVPAAVWSRDTCPEHQAGRSAELCSGDRFRHTLSRDLARHGLADLPDVITRVRAEVAAGEEGSCATIVLLWDDPENRPEPNAPLVELA